MHPSSSLPEGTAVKVNAACLCRQSFVANLSQRLEDMLRRGGIAPFSHGNAEQYIEIPLFCTAPAEDLATSFTGRRRRIQFVHMPCPDLLDPAAEDFDVLAGKNRHEVPPSHVPDEEVVRNEFLATLGERSTEMPDGLVS